MACSRDHLSISIRFEIEEMGKVAVGATVVCAAAVCAAAVYIVRRQMESSGEMGGSV